MAVMRLCGKLAESMVKVSLEARRMHVSINKKAKATLHIKLLNALNGMLKAALLFHKKMAKDLIGIGFKLNLHDPCVANKMIDGKQMTLCWHG
jgi:hypothetical protein